MALDCLNVFNVKSSAEKKILSSYEETCIEEERFLIATAIIMSLYFIMTLAGCILMATGLVTLSCILFGIAELSFAIAFLCLSYRFCLKRKLDSQLKIFQNKEKNLEEREKFLEEREAVIKHSQKSLDIAMQDSLKYRYPLYTLTEDSEREELEEFEYLESMCNL